MDFNISYSAYSMYIENQLLFYYNYVEKAPPDSKVPEIYSQFGTCMHSCCERFLKDRKVDIFSVFEEEWKKSVKEPTNKKAEILQLVLDCVEFIAKTFNKDFAIEVEKHLHFQEPEYGGFNVKGFIDVFAIKNNEIYIYDWKSNTMESEFFSPDVEDIKKRNHEKHKLQRLFYSWLCWKVLGKIPKECSWFYVKIKKEYKDSFTLQDVEKFDLEIKKFIEEIKKKGYDINQYEIGDVDGMFNAHKIKCLNEKIKREKQTQNTIVATIKNNMIHFSFVPTKLDKYLDKRFSYTAKGVEFSDIVKSGRWDGITHKYSNKKLPYAFKDIFENILKQYNSHFNETLNVEYVDKRNKKVLDTKYDTKFKDTDIVLRYYQEEAIKSALKNKIGIIAIGTSGGKTFIAGEIFKRLNNRSLFIVSRIELAKQTRDEFEKYLGVETGLMTEGNLVIDKQITVASIQTIYSILNLSMRINRFENSIIQPYYKNLEIEKEKEGIILSSEYKKTYYKNFKFSNEQKILIKQKSKEYEEEYKQLQLYLYNVNCAIMDECHLAKDVNMYKLLKDNLTNIQYCIGMTGTPFRSDGADLEMFALVGYPIYVKSSKELQDEDFISASICYFLKYGDEDIQGMDYHNAYNNMINNENRNNMIIDLCKKHEGKRILIIVNRIEHGQILQSMIPNSDFIYGNTGKEDRKDIFDNIRSRPGVMIGMSQIMSTGINLPQLDVLINCGANKSDNTTIQTIGRVLRKAEGKDMGIYYDFMDEGWFEEATEQRIKILKQFGHNVIIDYILQ